MNLRTSLKVVAFGAAFVGLMTAPVIGGVSARQAAPEPVDLVETPAPCGTWLGISEDDTVACVLIVHLSPGAPAVDVWANGAVQIKGLEYGKDTGYLPFPAGDYDVAITAAGGALADAVWTGTVTVESGYVYHAVAMGTLAADDDAPFGLGLFERTVGGFAAGMAIVEAIHAAPDAPGMDLAPKGGAPVIVDLTFGNVSDDLALPAGTYDFAVSPTGTTLVAVEVSGTELEAGHIYTVYGMGTADPNDEFPLQAYTVVTHPAE